MNEQTVGAYLKSLKLMHRIILASVILFSFIAVFITKQSQDKEDNAMIDSIGLWIAPIVALLGIVCGTILFKRTIDKTLVAQISLGQKLTGFRTASILRWACIEAPMLLCTVLVFLTGNYMYLAVSFVLLVFYIMYTPSKPQIINHLQLSTSEQAILEDEYALV